MKFHPCNIETKMDNNNSERKHTKKAVHLTHNLDSTGHVISILHDGQSCNIETTWIHYFRVSCSFDSTYIISILHGSCNIDIT